MAHRLKNGKKSMPSYPKQCTVYWFDPEPAKGSEIRKIRPCIVVSPDQMNKNLRTVIIVPLTSSIQPWPFRVTLMVMGRRSSVACDQIRAVDKSRLKAHISDLKSADREKLFARLQLILS
jgi:mRNA interferase MazF